MMVVLTLAFTLVMGCTPKKDGLGAEVPEGEALRMAREGSPLVEVDSTETYTAPPTVHVVRGRDKDGREVIVWVYTTVIRYAYADQLISPQTARDVAQEAGFSVEAVRKTSLQVFQGHLDDRANPVFWRLETNAGWIWVDAETERVLRRLDAQ